MRRSSSGYTYVAPFLATMLAAGSSLPACKAQERSQVVEFAAGEGSQVVEAAVEEKSQVVEIAIVETSDLHGYLLPYNALAYVDPLRRKPDAYLADLGGVEWFHGYLDVLREKMAGRVVLLDCGDMFQGTIVSNYFEGAPVISAMNRLGYAAAALGNHDFDFGADGAEDPQKDPFGAIKKRAEEAEFPILAANLIDRKTGKMVDWKNFAPYRILDVSGVKVAVIGAITEETPKITQDAVGANLQFLPIAPVIERYAAEVREKGAQIVVASIHAGGFCEKIDNPNDISTCDPAEEMFLVAQSLKPGTVDLIVGGHSHAYVRHYVNSTPLLQVGANGIGFGLAVLKFSKAENKVVGLDFEMVANCQSHFKGEQTCFFLDHLPGEESVAPVFKGKEVKPVRFLDSLLSEEQRTMLRDSQADLGVTADRNLDRLLGKDHPVGLLVAQILLDTYPEAQVALMNESGMRAPIVKGKLTKNDVFQIFPFDSGVGFIRMPGSKLSDLVRLSTAGAHGMLVQRGLRVVVDLKKDECIAEDWDKDGEKEKWERNLLVSVTMEDASPIVPDKEYLVVTNDYLSNGGSDFSQVLDKLPEGSTFGPERPITMRDIFLEWLRKHPGTIGGAGDTYTELTQGMAVQVLNPEHIPGKTCPAAPKTSAQPAGTPTGDGSGGMR